MALVERVLLGAGVVVCPSVGGRMGAGAPAGQPEAGAAREPAPPSRRRTAAQFTL